MIFSDKYCIDMEEIWQMNVHSHIVANCHGVLGEMICDSIHLPIASPTSTSMKLGLFCEDALSLQMEQQSNILKIECASSQIGKTMMRIHCVDGVQDCIAFSILLAVHVTMPKVTNSFIIHIEDRESDNDAIVTRKLPHNNGYNQAKIYELVSNDPSVIRVVNPSLTIAAKSTAEFVLEIRTANMLTRSKEILLFVTESGTLEQCIRIEVKMGNPKQLR